MTRRAGTAVLGLGLAALPTYALTATIGGPAATDSAPADLVEGVGRPGWGFSVSASAYLVPDSREYVQPTFAADRGWLHLEARYNYENLETGSAWLGYNLGGGRKLEWELTPLLGGVFGETTGVAPGYKGALRWWQLELYSEGEYMFDVGASSDSFFYNWSELSLPPVAWFRVGLVAQRTRVYATELDVQRGFLVGFAVRSVAVTTYVFNPDESQPTLVFALGVDF